MNVNVYLFEPHVSIQVARLFPIITFEYVTNVFATVALCLVTS